MKSKLKSPFKRLDTNRNLDQAKSDRFIYKKAGMDAKIKKEGQGYSVFVSKIKDKRKKGRRKL